MDELIKAQAEQRREYAEVLGREQSSVRRVIAMVGVSARDTSAGWEGFAEHLDTCRGVTSSSRDRSRLNRAAVRAREIARLAAAVERDLAPLVDRPEVNR